MPTRKEIFVYNVQAVCKNLISNIDDLKDLKDLYTSEEWAESATNEIIDDDITSCGITAESLHNVMTAVAPAFSNLVSNLQVNAGLYGKYMDKVRLLLKKRISNI